MKKIIALSLALLLCATTLWGCGNENKEGNKQDTSTKENTSTDTPIGETSFSQTDEDMFTKRDLNPDYEESECIAITLMGNSATASDPGVTISGNIITITKEASYLIKGNLENGMLVVDAEDSAKLQLVFEGVSITNENSAALFIKQADKVFITLAENSENTLSNAGEFSTVEDNKIDGTIYSKEDLTFNGSGSLTVSSATGHGIVCKDDLVFTGGTYVVEAASQGLDANDSVRITNTTLTIDSGKDGIHAENKDEESLGFVYISGGTINIQAEGDGISAGSYIQITDGVFDLLAGGGSENGTKSHSSGWGNFGGFGGGMPGGGGNRGDMPEGTPNGGSRPDRENMERPSGDMERPDFSSNDIKDSLDSTQNTSSAEESTSMKGLKSGGDMLITGGVFTINSADDAIHSNGSATIQEGSFTLASGDDAIHAEENLQVTDGTITISESYEGLEALHITVSGGEISLTASDDGFNAAGGTDNSGTTGGRDGMFGGKGGMSANSDGSVLISGGTIHIKASGDGIDANGTLEITGGHTTVTGPTQGDTATLDYDLSGTITGGTFLGTGASTMAQTFSSSTQGVIALSVGSQSEGTLITVKDASGNTLLTHTPELSYQVVILSSPDLVSGETYTVTVGNSSGEFEAN